MSMLSIFFAVLFNVAAIVLFAGLANRIRRYARSPAPLKIATTPAPMTQSGVYWRLVREVVYFESLFKSSKWTWIFGWAFHFTLFLVVLRHLRYFQEPVWLPIAMVQPFGTYGGFIMVAALGGLWGPTLAGRPGALYLDTVRSLASGFVNADWHLGFNDAFRLPHGYCCCQGFHVRFDAV
jgi:nitrate reductase gamma subunit